MYSFWLFHENNFTGVAEKSNEMLEDTVDVDGIKEEVVKATGNTIIDSKLKIFTVSITDRQISRQKHDLTRL